jgi:glycosyltransferase involved in cell wall biosynthesis
MRKVLFISHSAGRTGAPLMLLNFLRWLKENSDIHFEILLKTTGELRGDFAELAPTHIFAQPQKKGFLAKIQSQSGIQHLLEHYRRSDISLIYSNTITNGEILEALAPLECPVITHVHELDYWIHQFGLKNLEKVKKHTTHYIAASQAVLKNLTGSYGIPGSAIDVAHSFIPLPEILPRPEAASHIRQELNIPADAFVVVGSGYETWRKGKDLFVQLAYYVHHKRETDNIYFLWVGGKVDDKEFYEISHDIKVAGLERHVHFCGEVANPLDYFAASDIFALVSREDPFPLVCLEAAMLGKPILCFDNAGGMPEFVENDAGFIVPYLDIDAMADKAIEFITDEKLRQDAGESAAHKVRKRDVVSVAAPKILRIINRFL